LLRAGNLGSLKFAMKTAVFNVHSRIRARTRHEAERLGKWMIRSEIVGEIQTNGA